MRYKHAAAVLTIGIVLILSLPGISAEGQIMSKTDEENDVLKITDPFAEEPSCTDDLDIISASIDWSGSKVLCEFTVKGEVTNISSDGTKNIYYFNIDIKTEKNEEDIWFLYCDTGFTGGSTETGAIFLWEDDFTSIDGTFSFQFDKSHFGNHTDVIDIEIRAQNVDGWLDEIRWDEGFPSDDDDTTDDDTDDDTSDDDTDDDTEDDDEEDDSPGFPLIIMLGSVLVTIAFIGSRRRRD